MPLVGHLRELRRRLVIAVLAGLLMQSVFRDEIPRPDAASVQWLVFGVATFTAISFIS